MQILEQAPELAEIGAGIQISANASRVLHGLGLERALTNVAVIPAAQHFRVYSTGELLHEIPLGAAHERAHGAKYYHLHRADLHAVLAAKLSMVEVAG